MGFLSKLFKKNVIQDTSRDTEQWYLEIKKKEEESKISDEVFSNIMRGTLLNAYENSTLSSYENEYYTTNLDNEPKTR